MTSSNISLENNSAFDVICDAIVSTAKGIASIRIEDLPKLWDSICDVLKNIGSALFNMVKNFFFTDLPGLIIDVGFIATHLVNKDLEKAGERAKSALKHLMKVLEVLALVPIFSVICSILLSCIYLCQQDWVNAVCALI